MFLCRHRPVQFLILGGLVMAFFLTMAPASIAESRKPLRVPAGLRGFQVAQMMQKHAQEQSRAAVTPKPTTTETRYVAVRGPDGQVRTFKLEGQIIRTYRPSSIAPQFVTVRGPEGQVRSFALEGEIISVQPSP
ncbi:MAG: hypothetical protein ACK4RK_13225 [Gemmataceae bacterium]